MIVGSGRTINVCMVTSRFFPEYGGGAKQALSLCQKLKDRGINPIVVTFNHDKRLNSRKVIREIAEGIEVNRVSPLMKRKGWTACANLLNFLIRERKKYHILHVHGVYYQAYIAALTARALKKKIITKISVYGGDDPLTISRSQLGLLKLRIISLVDRIICTTSQLFANSIKAGLKEKHLVRIPNGVDVDKFKPLSPNQRIDLRNRLGIGDKGIVVMFTGILYRRKGLDLLLKAFKQIARRDKELKLILVGPCEIKEHWGIDEDYVRTLRRLAHPLGNRLIFTGYVHNVEDYLRAADIFVLPSWREGLPNSLLEAMACGLPCVATRLPWNQEIIRDGENGLLFQAGDIDDLTEKLLRLVEDSDLRKRMGEKARIAMVKNFSIDKIADKYVKLYRNLLNNK